MYGKGLRPLSIATVVAFAVTLSLVFFYAPIEADQGFLQKIFYLHVPLAIISLCGFIVGGIFAVLHLRRDDPRYDAYSYVSIHISVIFAVGAPDHRLDLGEGLLGPLVGLERTDAGQLPDRLPALRDLLPLPLRDRGPPAPGALRLGLRDHRRRLRAAQLPRRAGLGLAGPPARLRHRRRRPARLDDADLPLLDRLDGAAVDDAGQVRALGEERPGPAEAPAPRPRRADTPRRPRGSPRRSTDARPGSSPPRRSPTTSAASTSPAPTSSSSCCC